MSEALRKAAEEARDIFHKLMYNGIKDSENRIGKATSALDVALGAPEAPEVKPPNLPRAAERARAILEKLLAPEGSVKMPDIEHLDFEAALKILIAMLEDMARDIGTAYGWLDGALSDTAPPESPPDLAPELAAAEAALEHYFDTVRDALETVKVFRMRRERETKSAEEIDREALRRIAARYKIEYREGEPQAAQTFIGRVINLFVWWEPVAPGAVELSELLLGALPDDEVQEVMAESAEHLGEDYPK